MFIVLLEYIRPLDEIDTLIPAHRSFLLRHYASGHFLMSGRREPRTGGVIIASLPSKSQLQQVLQEDPFYQSGVVRYEIVEFVPTMTQPELDGWRQA